MAEAGGILALFGCLPCRTLASFLKGPTGRMVEGQWAKNHSLKGGHTFRSFRTAEPIPLEDDFSFEMERKRQIAMTSMEIMSYRRQQKEKTTKQRRQCEGCGAITYGQQCKYCGGA